MTRFLRHLMTGAVGLALAPAALAETVVQDVTVTASIEAACTVLHDVLDFGIYDPNSGTDRTATAVVDLTCPETTRVTISLNGGEHQNGSRRMAGPGGNFLRYHLYSDATKQPWGDGDPALGQPFAHTYGELDPKPMVIGELPAGQRVAPGFYTDTVTITVEIDGGGS